MHVMVVGSGLAGAWTAWWASIGALVTVLEKGQRVASGASGSAAGLANPFIAQKANPIPRFPEALGLLEQVLPELHVPFSRGVLRPARSADQAAHFEQRANEHPDALDWLTPAESTTRYPNVLAPYGSLWVRDALGFDPVPLIQGLLETVEHRGGRVHTETELLSWTSNPDFVSVSTSAGDLQAEYLVLALGADALSLPYAETLRLHGVKGHLLWTHRVPSWNGPALSGKGYIVPLGDRLAVGSTFEHHFKDREVDLAMEEVLRTQANALLPALHEAPTLRLSAGVRVSAPGDRLPLILPVDDHKRVWVFTGLGSKGILLAPLYARDLVRKWDVKKSAT